MLDIKRMEGGIKMNERIKQLAEQAGLRFTQLMSNPMVPIVDGKETDLEKFAELIVSECLDIVANADMTELEGPDPEDVLYVACKQIKQHFGVE